MPNDKTLNQWWFQIMKAVIMCEADHNPVTWIVMRHGHWQITDHSVL